MSQGKRTPNLA